MFDSLTDRLGGIFDQLKRRGALDEGDVSAALREVRVALLEADVALPVVKNFIADVRDQAIGAELLRSVTPAQMVVKIVHDHLIAMLGEAAAEVDLAAIPPVADPHGRPAGLGQDHHHRQARPPPAQPRQKKVLLAALDTQRPAAQEQLRVLGEQAGIATLPVIAGQLPVDIAKRALEAGRLQGYDAIVLDTAGRLHVDEASMAEAAAVRQAVAAVEVLLVADALTGQDAVKVAERFHARVGLTGIVLTRIDGDARAGRR